jgi:glutamate-1-semialdehyde 2,1-aminomutase
VFLLSTTHGAETHALAAAIACMQIYEREPVIEHLERQGRRLAQGFNEVISRYSLADYVKVVGKPCCLFYETLDESGKPSQTFRTLFLQETIRRGILMPSLVLSYSHRDEDINRTLQAIDGALGVYRRALEDGVGKYLSGRSSQIVYRKYNRPERVAE